MIDALPPEVWDRILALLPNPSDIIAVAGTCTAFRAVCLGDPTRSRIMDDAKTITALPDRPFGARLQIACCYGYLEIVRWLVGPTLMTKSTP